MQRKARVVQSALLYKGFELKNTHHKFFSYVSTDGRLTSIKTRISQGENEIHDILLNQMAKQCHLSKEEFLDLVDCPLDRTRYEEILIKKGLI